MGASDGRAVGQVAVGLRDGAKLLGLGTNALYTALREGHGPRTFRVGRRHLVRVAELERWARELEAQG